VKTLIRAFDARLRSAYGIYEFSSDPGCVLRIGLGHTPHNLAFAPDAGSGLAGAEIPGGEPALMLHLWNERVPRIPEAGPDLAWASRLVKGFVRSLHLVGAEMRENPALSGVRVVGAVTVVIDPEPGSSGAQVFRRLGFEVMPHQGRLGRFGEFWENFYTWWIMWTYNSASLRSKSLLGLRRTEMWMPVDRFLARYGSKGEREYQRTVLSPRPSPGGSG